MKNNVISAIFRTIINRKETKIFLMFSLYPLIFLIATLFPDSNFMQISVEKGSTLSLIELFNLLLGSINALTLPLIALYYLTYMVFKNEFDDSTMFLYKDINRSEIFKAKLWSLCGIVVIFLSLSFLSTVFANYIGAVRMPYGSTSILPNDTNIIFSIIIAIINTSLDYMMSIFIAMMMSFYVKKGTTVVSAIVIGIVTEILALIGGVWGLIYPTGYTSLAFEGRPLIAFIGSISITLFYMSSMYVIGVKNFKNLEF